MRDRTYMRGDIVTIFADGDGPKRVWNYNEATHTLTTCTEWQYWTRIAWAWFRWRFIYGGGWIVVWVLAVLVSLWMFLGS